MSHSQGFLKCLVAGVTFFICTGVQAATTRVCATANEWDSLSPLTAGKFSLACPTGQTVLSVDFASYGLPTGSCGTFGTSTCNSATSVAVIQSQCVGKSSCSIPGTSFNTLFGDPCSGKVKQLFVQVECSGTAVTPSPTPTQTVKPSPTPTATATTTPSGVVNFFGTTAPTATTGNDGQALNLGLKFTPTQNGQVIGVRFYKVSVDTGAHTGALWSSSGTKLAQVSFTGETASGWQQANFSSPVSVTANTTYVVSYLSSSGYYIGSGGYFTSLALTRGVLVAPSSPSAGGNGVYLYSGAVSFPNQSYNGSNYFVDVNFQASGTTPAPSPTPTQTVKPSPTPTSTPTSTPTPTPTATVPAGGTTRNISFTQIPYANTDLVAPGRGPYVWSYFDQAIPEPSDNGFQTNDFYYRYAWSDLETGRSIYNFNNLDSQMQAAIDAKQKFSMAIMTICSACGSMSYPSYLHTDMQGESVKDWQGGGVWVPNWNSAKFQTAHKNLLVAINTHLMNTSYKGIKFIDNMRWIDVRGYGDYGEWHMAGIADSLSVYPSGAAPTVASLNSLIDAYVSAFPDIQLNAMVQMFDANNLPNTMIPPDVGYHALTVKNNVGLLGWRRDNWGADDGYLHAELENNNASFNGLVFKTEIMNRWKFAPITGEPMNGGPGNNCAYDLFEAQVQLYHGSMVGNGNYFGGADAACAKTNIRNSFKRLGYRLIVTGGSVTQSNRNLSINLNWQNIGVAPTYDNWNVTYELRNSSGTAVTSVKSAMNLRLFLPASSAQVATDAMTVPSTVAAGTYNLVLIVRDPKGIMPNLPLAIQGGASDGSYSLGSVTVN